MLNIQKASAGSGKTYTLARNYILNLIAFQNESGEWKLRNARQIEDAIQHILAVTFTNKATNEMKQRIINNLSALSSAQYLKDKDSLNQIPYLSDFSQLTGEDHHKIGETSAIALRILLNNFSQFKISTIDSFFQEILRTFTYEANINDSYQLEIDSTFVAEEALDSAIRQLDSHPRDMDAAGSWFKILMDNELKKSTHWNPFNKSASSKSIYSNLHSCLAKLESEDFKEIKDELDLYFSQPYIQTKLSNAYLDLKRKAENERKNLLGTMRLSKKNFLDMLANNDVESCVNANFLKLIKKIDNISLTRDDENMNVDTYLNNGTVFKAKTLGKDHFINIEAMNLCGLIEEWKKPKLTSFTMYWNVYGGLLPYLGLMTEIRKFMAEVLDSNNLIKISDTSYILRKIIGDNDAPFVYERLGNRIDNYLIDEFQDTSRMQWEVIEPLVAEGLSKNKDSLIIGDPKQSIYRFRNADHRLISEVVPKRFKDHKPSGHSKEENTNWRSATNIVKFNNYFFRTLSEVVQEKSDGKGPEKKFLDLYSNVVQYPHNQKGRGYVEVRFFSKPTNEEADEKSLTCVTGNKEKEDTEDWFTTLSVRNVGLLISDLKRRGYSQKDIAVLVDKNEEGQDVVKGLIEFNDSQPANAKIDFISEESLLIGSSPAVAMILGILAKLSKPMDFMKVNQSEEAGVESDRNIDKNEKVAEKQKYYTWNDIKTDYEIFSGRNAELQPIPRIMKFLNEPEVESNLSKLIEDLPALSISAIVESIIGTFLTNEMRRDNAIYLASFQDLVNEYSGGYSNNPADFLEWWKTRGSKMSVASPEGTDAVQIMTIHKSKGLEFKCVILPFAKGRFDPTKSEWKWVRPVNIEGISLPPFLPVATDLSLNGTWHEGLYKEFVNQVYTDNLNKNYVAFTRAKNELYIFTAKPKRKGFNMSVFLDTILRQEVRPAGASEEETEFMMNPEDLKIEETMISYGTPFSLEEIMREKKEENEKREHDKRFLTRYMKGYEVNKSRPKLKSRATKVMPS